MALALTMFCVLVTVHLLLANHSKMSCHYLMEKSIAIVARPINEKAVSLPDWLKTLLSFKLTFVVMLFADLFLLSLYRYVGKSISTTQRPIRAAMNAFLNVPQDTMPITSLNDILNDE